MPGTEKPNGAETSPLGYMYFAEFPGRGEAARILLNYGSLPYTETRFPMSTWPSVKPTTPLGQVPVLTVNGVQLSQQSAIERYLAKKMGLYPEDPLQAAKVDMIAGYIYELMDRTDPCFFMPEEERPAFIERVLKDIIKPHFQKLSEILGDQEFFVDNTFTYVDITAFSWISLFSSGLIKEIPANIVQEWPNLVAHHDRVSAMPAIQSMYKDVKEGLLLAYAKPLAAAASL